MIPSAPAATAARASGSTSSRRPAGWDGSTITGRWVSIFRTGIALMSSVNRVEVSNVLIPRSQRMTSELPSLTMYSAAISRSSTVDERPRFSSTGFVARPTSERSEKFDMLRAPIWITSATSTTCSTWRGSISSVTSGRPVSSRASHEDLERLARRGPGTRTARCAA